MTDDPNGGHHNPGPDVDSPVWDQLKFEFSSWVRTDRVRELHAAIESSWAPLQRSACQTAAGRALWKHVTNDVLAEVLAGETYLRSFYDKIKKDRINKARETSGVILAVRTLWFDSKLEAAIGGFDNEDTLQVVLLGAGMDTRAYRLSCLASTHVFEVDFPEVLQMKASLIQEAMKSMDTQQKTTVQAKALTAVEADLRDNDWLQRLQSSGFVPEKNTVWILEGLLYYLSDSDAIQVLKTIAGHCSLTQTVLLADFMNKPSITLSNANNNFQFYSDWPDELLPTLGFSDVKLDQIGDPDARFGLLYDPKNMFDKLRRIPRAVEVDPDDGTPCCRLYLVQASGCPG